ncbi:MAG: hypothetical protein WC846_05130 [Candidatus Gracilibacteria bacterium]|jgi:hypothetical protein
MDKNITSYNQQGGITADTVNAEKIEQTTKVSSVKKRSWWYNPWLIGVIGGTIAAVIAGIILN